MKSKFLSINLRDIARGAIVAAGTAASTALLPVLQSGRAPTVGELQAAGIAGACAGCVYLLKNLFTNSEDGFLKPESN